MGKSFLLPFCCQPTVNVRSQRTKTVQPSDRDVCAFRFCRNTAVVPAAYGVEYGVAGGSYLRHSVGPISAHSVRGESLPLSIYASSVS